MKVYKKNNSQDTIITYAFPRIGNNFYVPVNQKLHRLEGAYFDGKYFDAIKYDFDFDCSPQMYDSDATLNILNLPDSIFNLTDYEKSGRTITEGYIEKSIAIILPGRVFRKKIIFQRRLEDSLDISIVDRSVSIKYFPKLYIQIVNGSINVLCEKKIFLKYGVMQIIKLW